ncbi:MAG: family 20 glycosylhydrolase [Chitinispirillaceae bacterium]|nr:family 20 glycosylhydrolase [Chitinispirillaceae bacterium]
MELLLVPQAKSLVVHEGCFHLHGRHLRLDQACADEGVSRILELMRVELAEERHCVMTSGQDNGVKNGTISIEESGSTQAHESYMLRIDPDRITLRGGGRAGAFYGVQTLRQLIKSSGPFLPCLTIDDSPDFTHRGFYHDVTRGKVPTLATLFSLVDILASYKINQLQLYVEHAFAFSHIPELWSGKDPLTPREIRELDRYCQLNHIELVPSIATFGHLYELLRIKRFEHLNELDLRASVLPHNLWDRMAHYTIDVSREESFVLIKSMLDEYLPLFSSSKANICCDETFDLGKGKNRQRAANEGPGKLYTDFVTKLIGVVRSHNKTPMLWGDMVLRYPELLKEFPADTVFLNWSYDPDVTPDASAVFARSNVRQYVCPGVHGWSRFANDIRSATLNIRKMLGYGVSFKASGVLTTDWGDCGHVNFLSGSFHGMALGAALSWNDSSYPDDTAFDTAFSVSRWGKESDHAASLQRELGSLCFYHFGNMYAWVSGIEGKWNRERDVRTYDAATLVRNHARSCAVEKAFGELTGRMHDKPWRQDFDELLWGSRAIKWSLELLSFKKNVEFGRKECPALFGSASLLIEQGEQLCEAFTRLWHERNKESELKNITKTFSKMFEKIRVIGGV